MTVSVKSIVSSVFCDFLSVTYSPPWMHQEEIASALDMLCEAGSASPWNKTGRYKKAFRIGVSKAEGRPSFLIVKYGPPYPKNRFLRIEFHPANANLDRTRKFLDAILPGGYAALVKHGVCTRIDATVDLHGVDINQLLLWYPGLRASNPIGNNGKLETYYLGAKTSNLQFCIYDKRKETLTKQKASNLGKAIPAKVATPPPKTRVEARIKHEPFGNLGNLWNPFGKLGVAYIHLVPGDDEKFRLFLKASRFEGPQNVLCDLSPKTREEYRTRLAAGTPLWWNSKKVWGDWPAVAAALTKAAPTFSMVLAQKQHQPAASINFNGFQ